MSSADTDSRARIGSSSSPSFSGARRDQDSGGTNSLR
eukprot:CAMPEP_0114573024 /NCGR_PEP_ID=MMETSP0114-20121206/18632_1 /TAXON_ID=31324 /ORGANISM="Goniomonas sp, Strain m" /LENGTH=36 /DNA_ID= /DNA_START= /DNA_END= /DNA_ORIENTATION=